MADARKAQRGLPGIAHAMAPPRIRLGTGGNHPSPRQWGGAHCTGAASLPETALFGHAQESRAYPGHRWKPTRQGRRQPGDNLLPKRVRFLYDSLPLLTVTDDIGARELRWTSKHFVLRFGSFWTL